jgi:hypothetical protein
MKRMTVCFGLAVLALGTAFADIEIGVGVAPPLSERPAGATDNPGPLGDIMVEFHGGFSFWWLFYASADAYVLPPFVVRQMTTAIDTSSGFVKDGQYRPGFLTLFDVGIRPKIGPIALSATAGVNSLYIYKEKDLPKDAYKPELGVNLRLGLYVFLNRFMAVTASGTTVFPSFSSLVSTMKAIGGSDSYLQQQAVDYVVGNLYPTVSFVLNL